MKRQKIYSIKNHDDFICVQLDKTKEYNGFLLSLLEYFEPESPDMHDEKGEPLDVLKEVDEHWYYDGDNIRFHQVVGSKRIFLIIETDQRDKLAKFFEEHVIFQKLNRKYH